MTYFDDNAYPYLAQRKGKAMRDNHVSELLTTVLPVVADSWDKLRGCDVYRLLDAILYQDEDGLHEAARIVMGKRPDLSHYVGEAMADLEAEQYYQ
jgi:hypothetical protein